MDDGSILSSCILLALLLMLAAYFAVCETAFASASRVRLRAAAEHGDARAKKALYVTEHFDRAITTILIGTNICHLVTAAYVTVLVTRRFGPGAVTVSTVITTLAVFFAGEMLPKSIGKRYSERLSLGAAGSLCFFMRIFTPVSAGLTAIGRAVSRLSPGGELSVTEDELYDIIEDMTDEGELSEERGELVNAALSFGGVTAESILTARVDMAAVSVDEAPENILALIRQERHSRIPVYEGSIDNIIGILPIRRYIRARLSGRGAQLRHLLDEAHFVHQSAHVDELLPYMSSHKTNLVIVTDNYGGTLGLVTVEDILEELVGEIWDEDDEVVETCQRLPDGGFSFDASVSVEDAFAFMEYEDPEDFDFANKLLGEWAYEQFDLIPNEGDGFDYNGLRVTVTRVENRRIRLLGIVRCPVPETEGGGEA